MSVKTAPSLSDDALIAIAGQEQKLPYSKVKDAVIQLSDGKYYYKTDTVNLVKVKGRFYRKKSKLIVELSSGNWALRKDLVTTADGLVLDKSTGEAVQLVSGEWAKKSYTVELNGKYYLMTDKSLIKCAMSGQYMLEDDAIALDRNLSPNPAYWYVHKSYSDHLVADFKTGGLVLRKHTVPVMTEDGNIELYHTSHVRSSNMINVFHKFRDATNPQLDRIDQIQTFQTFKHRFVQIPPEVGVTMYIHKNHLPAFMETFNTSIKLTQIKATAELKALLKYADDGPDENMAKVVKKINQPWPGKHNIYKPDSYSPVFGKTFVRTGGLPYTFGVELETSQGELTHDMAEKARAHMVGDRSIGAAEYVTPVLQGDEGLETLRVLCGFLANNTFVDDRCGLHVHVGIPNVTLDKHFAINAIKLGCQIEPALYASCPTSRAPMLKHCHSIMRYKDINDDNWREYLGAFVFGPEEVWKNKGDKTVWSMHHYPYGPHRNKTHKVDTWCGGRYKWLNLVHVLSKSSFNTCELRMFPGTTSWEKVWNYVLTSMAFVWFVENRPNLIAKGNVTLEQMLTAPFVGKHSAIADQLLLFYTQRIARFNRDISTMYPKEIPKAIF